MFACQHDAARHPNMTRSNYSTADDQRYSLLGKGRFVQVDPLGYDDQINLYAYVGNDPASQKDPSGECATSNMQAECETSPRDTTPFNLSQEPPQRVPSILDLACLDKDPLACGYRPHKLESWLYESLVAGLSNEFKKGREFVTECLPKISGGKVAQSAAQGAIFGSIVEAAKDARAGRPVKSLVDIGKTILKAAGKGAVKEVTLQIAENCED